MLKNKKILSPILVGVIFVAVVLLDLLTKEFIIKNSIPNVGDSMEVMPGFINFIYVQNRGGAWGVFSDSTIFLTIISAVMMVIMIVFYILRLRQTKEKASIWLAVSMGLICGGCFGNLVDRIFLGYVRDFINFQFMSFPVFNFADVALTIGMITLVVYFLFFYGKEQQKNKEEGKEEKDD